MNIDIQSTIAEILKSNFRALYLMGYEFQGINILSSELLGTYYEARLENTALNRIVSTLYIPQGLSGHEVMITRIQEITKSRLDEFDYSSTGFMEVNSMVTTEIINDFVERMELYLRNTEEKLILNFMPVLQGTDWKSDQMDWMGYK